MIFDPDAHVEESEEFVDSAPRVIEGYKRGFWLIDGRTQPKLSGRGRTTFGSPHLHKGAGYVDPERRSRIESQEMSEPSARLADMDQEGVDVSVVFPTIFLVYPLTEDKSLLRAMCRCYNEWLAEKCDKTKGRIRWVAALL